MSDPFLGEIRMFAGNFAPLGWSFCNGALLSIAENNALFALLGTTYGGDGQSTFALPDLRGRVPLHEGNGGGGSYVLGQIGGTETVSLLPNQLGNHSHTMSASNQTGTVNKASNGNTLSSTGPQGVTTPVFQPFNSATQVQLAPQSLTAFGSNGPHENLQPYLCVSFIIALAGVFPSQN